MFTARILAYSPVNSRKLCEKYKGSPNWSYLCTNIGDTTIKQIAKHTKYFKSSLGVILKFLKKIIEATSNMIIPCHFTHQSNPIVKNDKYE
tara:strand:+ start:485 stop:757 length:273 start_codon:yes stop_codon:yes gene_type:complete